MHLGSAFLPSFLFLALLTAPSVRGDASQANEPPRTDRYGDPLPPGVVARLGTERLKLIWGRFLTFSPDGRCLAAQSTTQELRVWDVPSGKLLLRLKTPRSSGIGGRNPLVFSPDSKAIALAVPSEMQRGKQLATVHIWDVATGRELHAIGGVKGLDFNLAYCPDGRYLFAAGRQVLLPGGSPVPVVRLDLTKGGTPKEYGNFYAAEFLGISRDGKTLTAVTHDRGDWPKRAFVSWDIATGKEIGRHTLTTVGMYAGRLSPDGSVYAAPAVGGKSIALVDPLTGRERCQARETDSPDLVSISADGVTMTSTTWKGGVRVWDVAAGKLRASFQTPFPRVEWTALSPDGKWLALTNRTDGVAHLWDVVAGRELHSFAGHRKGPLTVAFLKDGKEIVTVNREGRPTAHFPMLDRGGRPVERNITEWEGWSFRRWDAATGAERAVMDRNPKGEVWHTSFSADGRLLATVIHDGAFHLWDVESGKELRSWKGPTRETTSGHFDGKGGKTVIKMPYPATTEPAFSPDGKILLAGYGRKIYRWETATGRELPAFEVREIPQERFEQVTWCLPSPDERTLAVWSWGATHLFLLDSTSGKVKQLLKNRRPRERHSLAFSSDGRTIAIEENGAVSLWEADSGRPRGRLDSPKKASGLAFSPDGRLLVVGAGPESPLSLFDLATGKVVGRLRDDRGGGQPFVFSPDGSRLAVAGSRPSDSPQLREVDYCPVVLVCDVAELCGKKKIEEIANVADPSTDELESLWAELSGSGEAGAYRAIRRLGLGGSRAAALLKARLMDGKPPYEQRIARLIADLDDDNYPLREKASKELEKLGPRAEPALQRTLEGKVSAKVRMRVKRLLERLDAHREPLPSPQMVRLRTVEALEANGSPEARQALAELSEKATDERLQREAKASLTRLLSRRKQP